MTPQTLSLAALLCFIAGSGVALAGLRHAHPRVSQLQLVLVGLGVLLKTGSIGMACAGGGSHFFNSPSEITGLLAWALGCSYLLALSISAARSLGALILPMVSVLMILAETLSKEQVSPGVPANSLFAVHIISAFLGYGLFLTACGASVFYLQQGRMLKQKAFSALFADLPSLERLEKLELLCALLGFLAFSVAIGTGAVLAKELNKPFWLEPKVLSAQMTWLIFGVLLLGRAVRWLNGRAAAKFVLAGAALVLFTFALGHPFGRPTEGAARAPAAPAFPLSLEGRGRTRAERVPGEGEGVRLQFDASPSPRVRSAHVGPLPSRERGTEARA